MTKKGAECFLLVFSIITFILVFSRLASANLLTASVNPSIGETGKYQIYNFTVTNTNNPPGQNFTQVVILANLSANIASQGTGTSAVGTYSYSASSNKQSLSWSNSSGLVANGTTEYFWINASLKDYAYYNFPVAVLIEPDGSTNQITVSIFSNDTIPPSVDFIIPPTPSGSSLLDQKYIPVKVSASDSGSGIDNITLYLYNLTGSLIKEESNQTSPFFYNFTGLQYGTYKIGALVKDVAGNTKQSSTLTINLENSSESSSTCTNSDWSCSWGSCVNGTKTQRCIDLNGCNSTIWDNQTASCSSSSSACSPLLNCTLWLPACGNGVKQQTKTCIDLNNCTSPSVSVRNCTTPPVINSSQSPPKSFHLGVSPSVLAFSGVLALIIVVIIAVILFLRKMRNS